jgi:transcriptional regulator with XRE-family HTH domain
MQAMAGKQTKVGKRIEDLRQARDMSQHDLSVASGVDKVTLWRIESGETQNPSIEKIVALAKGLRVPVSEITDVEDSDETYDQHLTPQQQQLLEAIPAKATITFADFTRRLFSMPEEVWGPYITDQTRHFTIIKGMQIAERQASYEPRILPDDAKSNEQPEEDDEDAETEEEGKRA